MKITPVFVTIWREENNSKMVDEFSGDAKEHPHILSNTYLLSAMPRPKVIAKANMPSNFLLWRTIIAHSYYVTPCHHTGCIPTT
jgi:hypothetical protein